MFRRKTKQGLFRIQRGLVFHFSFPVPFPNQKGKREEKPSFFLQKSPSFSILLYISSSFSSSLSFFRGEKKKENFQFFSYSFPKKREEKMKRKWRKRKRRGKSERIKEIAPETIKKKFGDIVVSENAFFGRKIR